MGGDVVPKVVERFVKDLVCNGYMVTYLGDELNTGKSRLMITGHHYRVEVECLYTEGNNKYNLRYKLTEDTDIDVGLLDDLRDIIEPSIQDFVVWLATQEPFAYIYQPETDKIRSIK